MYLEINGGRRLSGAVRIEGAKNAVLPACAASLLTDEPVVIHRVPPLRDVRTILEVIEGLGKEVACAEGTVVIRPGERLRPRAERKYVEQMRASFLVLAPLLSRLGRAVVPLPGGCTIGPRPVNYHLQGLAAMGAQVEERNRVVILSANELRGTRFRLPYPSVGATEQLLMAASLARGETVIENPAREPEVLDLVRLLRKMGAEINIEKASFKIEGQPELHGAEYTVIPDRLEAGTYLIAGAITHGRIEVEGVHPPDLAALLSVLAQAGMKVIEKTDKIMIDAGADIRPVRIATAPHPGFPTDLQPPLVALLSLAAGKSEVTDTVFPQRFGYVPELQRMGARIDVAEGKARISGIEALRPAEVTAPDIRAGAALVLAGLGAQGTSRIYGLGQIDRGYARIEEKLNGLGAEIVRTKHRGLHR